MALKIIRPELDYDTSTKLADALERVARETLAETLVDDVSVRFGTWRSETGTLQLVCKVEAAGDPFLPGWRWWSRLCDSPDDLRGELESLALARGPQDPRARTDHASGAAWTGGDRSPANADA